MASLLEKGVGCMSFSNAAKGVKRIYTAEILKLFGYICLIIGVATSAVLFFSDGNETFDSAAAVSLGALVASVIMAIGYVVLMVTSFIMNLVGYINARNDNENFKTALVFLIVGIVFSVVQVVVLNKGFGSIMYSLSTLSETLATIFVIAGVMQIAFQLGREDIGKKGATVLKLIIAVECITFVLSFFSTFFRGEAASFSSVSVLLMGASILINFIKYILYLLFLSKSKKMLAENQ